MVKIAEPIGGRNAVPLVNNGGDEVFKFAAIHLSRPLAVGILYFRYATQDLNYHSFFIDKDVDRI